MQNESFLTLIMLKEPNSHADAFDIFKATHHALGARIRREDLQHSLCLSNQDSFRQPMKSKAMQNIEK